MKPTNCGYIPNGSMGEPIHGPLEAVLTPHGIPTKDAVSHMNEVYRLIGGTPVTVLPNYPHLWPRPYYDSHFVRVVVWMTSYDLVVEYLYAEGYGRYICYAVADHYYSIITVHHIHGLGNLLSIVQVVKDYCNEHASRYAQCRTCWYQGSSGNECGQGLEMNTGDCSSWVGRASPIHNHT